MMNEEKKPKNGITEAVSLDNQEFRVRMDRIVKALKDAGYDPYMQSVSYTHLIKLRNLECKQFLLFEIDQHKQKANSF